MKGILKIILLKLILLGELSYSQSSASIQVKCDGSIDGTIGNEFTISIDVNNVTNFLGASFNLTYNSTYLDYVTATAGSWIGNSSDLIFFPAADEVTGIVSVGITRKGTIGAINGTGNIVSIRFRVTSLPGQTTTLPFTLSAINAIDPNGGSIPLAQINDSTQLIIQGDYILTITSANGTVTKNPDLVSYTSGSAVILTATPNQGYMFSGWGGDANGTINPITVTMDGNKNIIANFTIIPILPTINVSNTLINFGEVSINTISAEKSYNITGINLTATVVISAPNGFQISRSRNQGFTTSLILAPNAGVVNETIFVRFLPNETKNYVANITNTSAGATTQNVEVSGTGILPPQPTVNVNNTTLIFGDVLVNTNSSPKSYILSGSNLSSNITIEAPSSFQISINETFGFGSSITLNATNGTVNNTLIWVRFSPTVAQNYSDTISNVSAGAATQNVSVIGTGGHKLTTSSNPIEGGTTSGGGIFKSGINVAIGAKANSGYTFSNWTENGSSVSTNPNYQFTMPNNHVILVANFAVSNATQYSVSLISNPANGGTASGGGTYYSGSLVTVTATPNSGYTFTSWTESGMVVSTNASYTFTINGHRTLTANFAVKLSAPVAMSATNYTPTGFTANWKSVTGASGYYIDIAVDPSFTLILSNYFNKDVGNNTFLIVTGLDTNNKYYYRIRAYNAAGISPNSNTITEVTEIKLTNPTSFILFQNCPNPFNPSTKIRFDIPQQTQVKLSIYDLLGKELDVLVDKEMDAGSHEIIYNGGKLSSGVYIYRIQSYKFSQTKKFLLLK